MPETWQSFLGNSDSSSAYSTDLSRPTLNHQRSLYVEDIGRQGASDEGSRRAFSVFLDDTRLIVPPTPSDLNSSAEDISSQIAVTDRSRTTDRSIDQSSCKNAAEQSDNKKRESITNLSPGVVAYRTVNDSAYSGQSLEEIPDFDAGVVAFTHTNRPLSPVISERPEENSSCHTGGNQLDLEIDDRYPNKPQWDDRIRRGQTLEPVAEFDFERQVLPLGESSNIINDTTYETGNESTESSIKDSLEQRFEDAPSAIDTNDDSSNETRRTISTSILLNEEVSFPSRSSAQYPPVEATASRHEPSAIDMDRRVRELENEAHEGIRPRSIAFVPQDLKISQRGSVLPQEANGRRPIPRSVSLLNKILIPVAPDYTGKEIPVLRSVGSPRLGQQETQEQPEVQETEPVKDRQAIPQQPEPVQPKPIERSQVISRSEGLTYSQVDMALEILKQFQDELREKAGGSNHGDDDDDDDDDASDNSSHENISYHDDKGYEPKIMPSQRVDSDSIDPKLPIRFWQKFSIWRVLLVILTCMLIPPFFFIIAAGHRVGFSDFRIIRLITHPSYRAKIWKGFLWDINVKWFRWLCLLLGILETLGIFAGIAVGFGVGLGTE
ncbi:hypothetical protein ZYGR_0AF04530 [Zygosaccharomyces rouxii]|uniref:Uncharacterized protein n=1 Tax=Zygosaccharomyces rouxii TaxID=4956 RepID=A0A1Q3A8N6_ZYGRO|nr:hypothetical protein ZYGR_0AF04530 [Zygosaccharomyces rouxii]